MPVLGIIASSRPSAVGAFESIATVSGTGSTGTIVFSSIPQTYKHLQLRGVGRSTYSGGYGLSYSITFNGNGSAVYDAKCFRWDGANSQPPTSFNQTSVSSGYTHNSITTADNAVNTYGAVITDIPNYASTTQAKTARTISGYSGEYAAYAGSAEIVSTETYFNDTTAISSMTLTIGGGSWTTGTKFSLYGIKG